ncbi:MAG TPA: CzcE family metal-binding protein [Noviherbaspirillum sp.]|nr:CzcE family metal-binding protein [Noviherbaspirillum sp.]
MKQPLVHIAVIVLLSACAHRDIEYPIVFLGDPAPLNLASQTIAIRPDTRWVNVTGGDTVRFDVGEKSFAWTFNVARSVSTFDLRRVAPAGMLDHRVDAYVAPDPKYIGGDGDSRL